MPVFDLMRDYDRGLIIFDKFIFMPFCDLFERALTGDFPELTDRFLNSWP